MPPRRAIESSLKGGSRDDAAPRWPLAARTGDGVDFRIRPITPADGAREREFILSMSPESRHMRFMHAIHEPSARLIEQLVNVDPHRALALAAVIGTPDQERIIGVARYAADDDGQRCEFAVAVADEWQCRGLATTLVPLLFEQAARAGFQSIYGTILADNQRMIEFAEWLGLKVEPPTPGQSTVRASRRLN